jgi:serine/threonine-protein kinase 24/25/MST4
LIPKNPPPQLDASFSKPFREFVSFCLQRDPAQRPTAKDLLRHRFIKSAKRSSTLVELIDRLERFKAEGGERPDHDDDRSNSEEDEGQEDLWDFGTVRNPTMRGVPNRSGSTIKGGNPLRMQQPSERFGTGASSSTINGATVRQGAVLTRPAIPGQSGQTHASIAVRDYAADQTDSPSTSMFTAPGESRFVSAAEAYELAANGRHSTTAQDDEDEQTRRLAKMRLNDTTRQAGHGKDGSNNSVGSIDSRTAASISSATGSSTQQPQGHHQDLTALDTVLLPVLEQLSLAVSRNPAAQQTIRDLGRAFVEAEKVTKGFSNAFSIEVFHAMREGQEEEEDDGREEGEV